MKFRRGQRIEKKFSDGLGGFVWLVGVFVCYYDDDKKVAWVKIDEHQTSPKPHLESTWVGFLRPAGLLDQIAWAARKSR